MKRLDTIEAARAVAAISVVCFHANAAMGITYGAAYQTQLFFWGDRGVDFFFVLSGFIIGHVHGSDIGQPERFRDYVLKRIIRIFPILWFVAGSWIALKYFAGAGTTSVSVAATSLFLIPSLEHPVPLVVWTLRHEMLFYLMFGLLIASRTVGTVVGLFWLGGCLLQLVLLAAGRGFGGLAAMILSAFQLQFAMGMLAAWMYRRHAARYPLALLICAMLSVVIVIALTQWLGASRRDTLDYVSAGATIWVLVYGVALAALVYGLAVCSDFVTVPRWATFLGAASYAIYLVHVPAISLAQRAFKVLLPAPPIPFFAAVLFGLIVAGIGAGCALHIAFERPVTRLLRKRLLNGSRGLADLAPARRE